MLPLSVLVIDDEASIVRIISENLEELGLKTSKALSGRAALAALEDSNQKFNLIVLDLGLGSDISGWHILEQVHARESRHCETPVLVISGNPEEDSRARDAGASEFLPKPFRYLQLIGCVEKLLDLEFE